MKSNGGRRPMTDGLHGSHGSSLILNPDLLHVLEHSGSTDTAELS